MKTSKRNITRILSHYPARLASLLVMAMVMVLLGSTAYASRGGGVL